MQRTVGGGVISPLGFDFGARHEDLGAMIWRRSHGAVPVTYTTSLREEGTHPRTTEESEGRKKRRVGQEGNNGRIDSDKRTVALGKIKRRIIKGNEFLKVINPVNSPTVFLNSWQICRIAVSIYQHLID